MNYILTFKIGAKLQSVIIAAPYWEEAHSAGLQMLAKMRRRHPRKKIALHGVGFCVGTT